MGLRRGARTLGRGEEREGLPKGRVLTEDERRPPGALPAEAVLGAKPVASPDSAVLQPEARRGVDSSVYGGVVPVNVDKVVAVVEVWRLRGRT